MIFPEFKGKVPAYWNTDRWAYNLSQVASGVTKEKYASSNIVSPYLNSNVKERLSENAKKVLHADYLYGGWMEDRSYIWRGSYMEPSKFLHLGTDFVVPENTKVAVDNPCEIVQIYCDTPEEAGWGTRIMVQLINAPNIHLVYGHLSLEKNIHKVGDKLLPDDIIGYIGSPSENGGWSAHLHVQAIASKIDKYLDDPASLDGYGELSEFDSLVQQFPDPIRFIEMK